MDNIYPQIHGLERHRYAPELNTLHFKDGTEFRTPHCTTIEEAVDYFEKQNKYS